MYANDSNAARARADCEATVAKFTIELIHSDGLFHRHYRCGERGTVNKSFHIVTWPGSLCYTGDMGDYLFQRTENMIAFMRGSAMSYSYAAEKCVASDGPVSEWSYDLFCKVLDELVTDAEHNEFQKIEELREQVTEIKDVYSQYSAEHDAMRALYESRLMDDIPRCHEYTFHFLWALHAIKWFCDHVDEAKEKAPVAQELVH